MNRRLIAKRIERFFRISSLVCADCGELSCIYDENGNVVESLEDYGIHNKEEWDREMDKEINWLRKNRESVLSILPDFQNEWPESCKSLRMVLTMANLN